MKAETPAKIITLPDFTRVAMHSGPRITRDELQIWSKAHNFLPGRMIALACGVSLNTAYAWLNGRTRVNPKVRPLLVEHFGDPWPWCQHLGARYDWGQSVAGWDAYAAQELGIPTPAQQARMVAEIATGAAKPLDIPSSLWPADPDAFDD